MSANTPHLTKFISSFNPRLVPYYGVEKFKFKLNILHTLENISHI